MVLCYASALQTTVSVHNVPSLVCRVDVVFLDAEPAAQLSVHLLKSSMITMRVIITHWCK